MLKQIKDFLHPTYLDIKDKFFAPKNFDVGTLPWIDRPEANISEGLKGFEPIAGELNYDMAEKLNFWRKNGYVILEKAISTDLIDNYLTDIEHLLKDNKKFNTVVRIDLPKFQPNAERKAKDWTGDDLREKFVKINDFHSISKAGKELMSHSAIGNFLWAVFQQQPVAFQSLTFLYGSQQPTHQDFAWVRSNIASHLVASWIALEDVKIDSGPLYYYVGSHKIPKFNFGNGILYSGRSTKTPLEFADYLDKTCTDLNLPKENLIIKKGDVLLWHAALTHGGNAIENPEQTRKSMVCHYSTKTSYPYHRLANGVAPVVQNHNGLLIYGDPNNLSQENML